MYFFNTVVGDADLLLDKKIAMAKYTKRRIELSSDKTSGSSDISSDRM